MPICSSDEHAAMPGYLTPAQMAEVRKAAGAEFDAVFIRMMSLHHAGAVQMACDEWHSSGDLRLRLMAQAIRREQKGEIALMKNVSGIEAVRQATRNMSAFTLLFRSPEASTRRSPCTASPKVFECLGSRDAGPLDSIA
ncbi:DUF305 domain-containing protein [Bradyrhizobium sp. 139]|uniref:DUF305 domain-containing protein n=1 Tax=Bradyrhizobium sp. 139 TaxID=2782616 RepID=UPI0021122502|nr:DUF305 domain-containing protein [Bradyrhizobium sp. 139]MCK1741289.1 DUF305 domain-containing protein [Bradyrhizobium sp. 139]